MPVYMRWIVASVRACAYHSLREQCMLVRRTALTEIQKRGRDLEEIGGVRQRVASLLTLLNAHRDAPHVQVSDLSHSSHPSHSNILLLFPSLSFLHSLTLFIPLSLLHSLPFPIPLTHSRHWKCHWTNTGECFVRGASFRLQNYRCWRRWDLYSYRHLQEQLKMYVCMKGRSYLML